MAKRSLVPKGGNDNVSTPDYMADIIVKHFMPSGEILEPCCGPDHCRPFVRSMNKHRVGNVTGIDIRCTGPVHRRDFLKDSMLSVEVDHWDWIVTNPPWSILQDFLIRSMEVSDNIVFLALLPNWLQKAKLSALDAGGFGIVEHLHLPDVVGHGWKRFGFQLGATWIRRGWTGSPHNNRKYIV